MKVERTLDLPPHVLVRRLRDALSSGFDGSAGPEGFRLYPRYDFLPHLVRPRLVGTLRPSGDGCVVRFTTAWGFGMHALALFPILLALLALLEILGVPIFNEADRTRAIAGSVAGILISAFIFGVWRLYLQEGLDRLRRLSRDLFGA